MVHIVGLASVVFNVNYVGVSMADSMRVGVVGPGAMNNLGARSRLLDEAPDRAPPSNADGGISPRLVWPALTDSMFLSRDIFPNRSRRSVIIARALYRSQLPGLDKLHRGDVLWVGSVATRAAIALSGGPAAAALGAGKRAGATRH